MEPVELTIITRNQTKEGLNEIIRDTNKVGQTVEQVTADFKARMKEQSDVVKQVEADIKALEKQLEKAAPGKGKMALAADLEAAKKVLVEEKGELVLLEKQVDQTSQKHIMLRTEIRNLKEQMAGMTEGTEEYTAAMQRLGEMQDRMGDINTQGRIFSDDNKNIKATMDAMSGLTGAMTAGVGVASLFGVEQEKLTEIQTRLQAVMAITMGVQQVANTLNKDSYFTHVLLTGAKNMLTAANARLAVSLGISNAAAQALMATLTLGLSVVITGLIVLWNKFSDRTEKAQKKLNTEIEKTGNAIQQISNDVNFEVRIAEAAGKSKKELIELRKEAAKTALAMADIAFDEVNIKFMKGDATKEQLEAARENSKKAWDNYNKTMQDAIVLDYEERTAKKKKDEDRTDNTDKIVDAELKARQKINDMTIALMEEGAAKKKALARKQFDDELARIDQEERERLKALQNAQKNGMTVTPEQVATVRNQAKQQRDLAGEKYIKDFFSVEKEYADKSKKLKQEKIQALIEYNKEYGTYQEKRLAVEMEFNEKISDISKKRKEAEKKGDTDTVEILNIALAKATKDKGKALIGLDYEQLKQSPDYIRAFENLKDTSSETLKSLLTQFEAAKQTAAKVLSPDQLREYTTTIQAIMAELDERNPFQALADRKKELAEAEEELAEAKRNLDVVNSGGQVLTGSSYNKDTGRTEKTYLSAAEALEKYNAAKDKAQKANSNFIRAERTVKEKVDELADAIIGIGAAIGGTAGEIISLIGDVALFSTNMIDSISQVTKTGVDAISAVEKASVILGIISTAMQLLQKMSELGSNKAFKQFEAYAEKIKEINALTDAVNEYRIAALEAQQTETNWFSEDNLRNLRDYKALHDEVFKAYVDKAGEAQAIYQNESGGGWLTGAFNWVMGNLSALSWWDKWKNVWGQGDYDKGQTAAINNLRIETRKKSKGFLGTGIGGKSQKTEDLVTWAKNQGLGDLFDDEGLLNKQLAQSLIDNYGNKLVGQTKETLEALIKLREQYDEYMTQLHEYVSSLYEPLVGNFVDSLWDWVDEGKDALSSFKEYASGTFRDIVTDMMRSIVLSKVVDKFDEQISGLYEKYAKGDIDEQELMRLVAEKTGELMGRYESNLPTLEGILETVNEYFKKQGIDLAQPEAGTSQSGRAGAVTTITEETAGKIEGIATAIQIRIINMDENLTDISQYAYEAIGILNTIAENTAFCKYLEGIADGIDRMERDGVKMK